MTLSRTARILIAILLLAAAVFFWVNFFSQEPPTPATLTDQPSPTPTPPTVAQPEAGAGDSTNAGTAGTAVTPSETGTNETATNGDGTPTVVVPNAPNVATRDLQVAELPFLVTEPPTTSAGATSSSATDTGGANRPQGAQRVSVNPFSPIVVQAPAARAPIASAPATPPASSPAVITESASASGTTASAAPPTPVRAPAPRPLTPPSPQTATLPRQLPSGTLPVAPDILRTSRTQPVANAPADLGQMAAVREPGSEPLPNGSLGTAAGGEVQTSSAVPQVLGPRAPQAEGQAGSQAAGGTNANGTAPLQAGTDALSRYLRDHNVRFTGTVLGPVSVGVFRSALYRVPVVLSLGQKLPETNIVLTDIRGHEAQFKLDETTQTLSLDLRR